MVRARSGGDGHCMTQELRKPARYGLPIVLFALGVALLIAEQNPAISWAVIVGSLAFAARLADDAPADKHRDPRAG
jgi:hypothetical protein